MNQMSQSKIKDKPKTRIEELTEVHRVVSRLLVEEARRHTRPREYTVAKMTQETGMTQGPLMRSYDGSVEVPPGETFSFFFGVEHEVLGSGIEGLPETVERTFSVEFPFAMEHLVIEDEDAPHFTVSGIYLGGHALLYSPAGFSGARFGAERRVTFTKRNTMSVGKILTVVAKNTSDAPRKFRAKVVGREVCAPEPIEAGVFTVDDSDAHDSSRSFEK